ncbi:hypothetical protein ABZ569_32745 [Streptomyces albus]|uniref:hypothetical protein n=1 Tax=Streptomyces albus TaxID=1888 RepID=UPI0033DF567D
MGSFQELFNAMTARAAARNPGQQSTCPTCLKRAALYGVTVRVAAPATNGEES